MFPIYKEKTLLIEDVDSKISCFQKFDHLRLYGQITEESPLSECPHAMNMWFTNGEDVYLLPKIYYGIADGTCYIGTIQKKKEKREKFHKDLERIFYKEEEYTRIYQNIVNRYFEAFGRLNYHFPEFEILNFPMQTSSSITFEISSPSIDSDDFLHQISNSIICQSKIKRNGLL